MKITEQQAELILIAFKFISDVTGLSEDQIDLYHQILETFCTLKNYHGSVRKRC